MSFWNSIFDWFWSGDDGAKTATSSIGEDDAYCTINPATGLPMVGGCGSVDVAGNPYGTDWSHDDGAYTAMWSIGHDDAHCTINPATGLPMVGGDGSVDVAGNPYGSDCSHDETSFLSNSDW